jgi:MobA/MobL family protein/AAA domain-containing protein
LAIYHLSASVISRARGQRIVAVAAARSATRLRDARYGITHNHAHKHGVAHAEILAPAGAPAWTRDREALWNRVEAAERRWDSQLARAIEVGLPVELSHEQGVALMRDFLAHEFVEHGMIADFSIRRGDPRNPHAHVLLTLRPVTASGFGPKARHWNRKSNLLEWRTAWAERANRHLARAGHDVRIDHRTLEAQQIELAPARRIGFGRPLPTQQTLPRHWQERIAERQRIAEQNGEIMLEDPTVAVRAFAQQRATFTRQELAEFLEPRTGSAAQLEEVLQAIMNSGEVLPLDSGTEGRGRFTSRHLLEAQKSLAKRATAMAMRRSRGSASPPAPPVSVDSLSAAERDAFDYLMTGGDLKALVWGTSELQERLLGTAREAWQAQGFRVLGIESRSLAEHDWLKANPLTRDDVLIVGGFDLIGLRDLERLLAGVDKARAKVVLVCDEEQLETTGLIPRSLLWTSQRARARAP